MGPADWQLTRRPHPVVHCGVHIVSDARGQPHGHSEQDSEVKSSKPVPCGE